MSEVSYRPEVFDVPDMAAAKRIVLTPQSGQTTDERWERETPYLAALAIEKLSIKPGALVIDYGCGIGRMAKALIEMAGCYVLGVDISEDMRRLAPAYVASARFSVVSRGVFQRLAMNGLRAEAAISIWVLQHAVLPGEDIALLRSGLATGAPVFVANNLGRAVPTNRGWQPDTQDVRGMLSASLGLSEDGRLDRAIVGDQVADNTFWASYRVP